MKKQKRMVRKLLIFVVMTMAMVSVGVSYAAWNSDLHIVGNFTTGVLSILFHSDQNKYAAAITDATGEKTLRTIDVDVELKEQGKIAKVLFQDALPIDMLAKGKLLRIDLPLQAGDESTLKLIQNVELDLDKPGEEITLDVDHSFLAVQGKPYRGDLVPEEFKIPLEFEVFRIANQEEHDMMAQVYLKMLDTNNEALAKLPNQVTMDEGYTILELEDETSVKLASKVKNGVVVLYSMEIPLYIDQVHAGELNE